MKRRNQIESLENMMNNIMENFDFQKCYVAMKALDWTWGLQRQPVTVEMLKTSARNRMEDTINYAKESKEPHNTPFWTSTGGLKCTVWKNRYGHICQMNLEFVLTEWEHDDDY